MENWTMSTIKTMWTVDHEAPGTMGLQSMILSMSLFICSIVVLVYYNWSKLNFSSARGLSSRVLLLNTMGWIKGIPIIWIDSPEEAVKVLKASAVKGDLIERLLSTPAWFPIISLESCDDPQWSRMKKNLVDLMKLFPPVSDLEDIACRVTHEYLANKHAILDSPGIVYCTVAAFYEWIFKRPVSSRKEIEFVCQSTWEWRKELAMKGKGSMELKYKVVCWILAEVKISWLDEIYGEKWSLPEYYSLLLQPFFISPAINITDIAAQFPNQFQLLGSASSRLSVVEHIYLSLDRAHPFVILERYLENGLEELGIPPQSHVFMPTDTMKNDRSTRFGAGTRKCPGQHIGMAAMLGIFTPDVLASHRFQPLLHHVYSGRDQDDQETLDQILYQYTIVLKLFLTAFLEAIHVLPKDPFRP